MATKRTPTDYATQTLQAMVGVRNPVDWTAQDRTNLRSFIKTQSGQRFINCLRNNSLEATVNAVWEKGDAGTARGLQAAFAFVCQLSAIDPLKVVNHDGRTALTETKTAESDSGEEEGNPFAGQRTHRTTDDDQDITEGLGFPIGPGIETPDVGSP